MADQKDFARRIAAIERQPCKMANPPSGSNPHRLARLLVTPLMSIAFMAAAIVHGWDVMDRPTDNPFEVTGILTSQLLAYLG